MDVEIVSMAISFLAVGISVLTYIMTFERDKTRDTIKAYEDLQVYLYHFYEYPSEEIEIFVDDRESDEYKALSNSLAHLEIFATGVKRKLYNLDVVYKMSHGYLDGSLRDRIEYMLEMKSKKYSDLYGNTKWLLQEMDKRSLQEDS